MKIYSRLEENLAPQFLRSGGLYNGDSNLCEFTKESVLDIQWANTGVIIFIAIEGDPNNFSGEPIASPYVINDPYYRTLIYYEIAPLRTNPYGQTLYTDNVLPAIPDNMDDEYNTIIYDEPELITAKIAKYNDDIFVGTWSYRID